MVDLNICLKLTTFFSTLMNTSNWEGNRFLGDFSLSVDTLAIGFCLLD